MRTIAASLAVSLAFLLSGCSTGTGRGLASTTGTLTGAAVEGVHGIVRGGQQPVTGATIKLWSVGTSGYGSSGSVLTTTTTDANGTFSITGTYSCPASDPYVYITSTGGNPGLTGGTNNAAISLMAALTDCNTLKTSGAGTFIVINEVTTVASAYALAQFMNTSSGAIGSWGYSNTGLKNAFSTVTNLVSNSTGAALATTPNGNGVVPQSEINTLADILAPCVNSSSNGSPDCTTLFGDLQGSPGNTLEAALSMALHPGYNAGTLYLLAAGTPPFQPTLSSAPNDLTVALSYNSGSTVPRAIAIDSSGNVWVANLASGGTNSRLSKLSTIGVPQSGSPFSLSMNGATALAIDAANEVWVGNTGNGTLVGYANTGNTFAGPISGLNSPSAMAFDANDDLWIANNGASSVAEFNPSSNSFISSGYTSQVTTPFAIAIDSSSNVWVGNGSTVTELSNTGVASGASPISSGGVTSPSGVAIDGSGDVWVSNGTAGTVSELNSSGAAVSGSGGYAPGASSASSIAIDGSGDAWVTDKTSSRLYELSSTGSAISPSTGYQGGGLNAPKSLAIDESGNVWVANISSTTTGSITTTISEFVGAAVPVYTPLAYALELGQIGVEPGLPIAVTVESGVVPYFTPTVSYSAQLYATGGNSGTYTWSLATGSLPSPMTLSSSGLISGTSSATGTSTFSVQACDSASLTNCSTTKTLTLTANTTIPALGNESALTGSSYAVLFEGYKNGSGAGQVFGGNFVGSVTFGSSGTLTGEIDINNYKSSSNLNTTLTGYYAFGSDNRGTMVIMSGSNAIEFAIAGENFSGSTPQGLRFIEFDDTVPSTGGNGYATGTGVAKLQTGAALTAATLNQSFAFGLQGETPCNNDSGVNPSCATIVPYGPLSAAGQFTGNNSNSITSGEEDAASINTSYNGITLSGSYTNPDSSGRGTLTLTPTGSIYPAAPTHFVYYIVNSGEMYLMSSDGHLTKSLLAGDALAQSGSFSSSTLTGNYVAYEQGGNNGDGVAVFPTQLDSSLIYLSIQSGSQIAVTIDENNGQGNVKLEQSQGPFSYAIDSTGRMTIGGSGSPIFYLANGTQAFGTEQPSGSNQGGPSLITVQAQTSGTYTCGPSSGSFAVGVPPVPIAVNVYTGIYVQGTNTFTQDDSDPYGILYQGVPGTPTCTTDSLTSTTGRFVYTTSFPTFGSTSTDAVYTIVPNSKYVAMSISPTDSQPNIIVIEK